MSLNKANIVWTGRQLKAMVKNGSIATNNIIQRAEVWNKEKKTYFIDSLLRGYPVPQVFTRRFEDGASAKGKPKKVYDLLDGKQRITTFASFLNDEWILGDMEPVVYEDDGDEFEIDLSGMKFSELPEEIKYSLETASLSIVYFDDLEKEEEVEMFKRLNSGQPLSAKSRTLASCRHIEDLLRIGKHDLFDEMLSAKAKENKNQVILVMKAYTMLNTSIEDISFTSKTFNPMVEQACISDGEEMELKEVFDFAQETHAMLIARKERKTAKKMYTETHLISLMPYFREAKAKGWTTNNMADFILEFYKNDNTSNHEEYNVASSNAAASNGSIVARDKELRKAFDTMEFKEPEVEETNEKKVLEINKPIKMPVTETHDEILIDALNHGTGYVNGKERVVQIFDETGWNSDKPVSKEILDERVEKLKKAWGIGGWSYPASGSIQEVIGLNTDSKGFEVTWVDLDEEYVTKYTWRQVEKALRNLVEDWRAKAA